MTPVNRFGPANSGAADYMPNVVIIAGR